MRRNAVLMVSISFKPFGLGEFEFSLFLPLRRLILEFFLFLVLRRFILAFFLFLFLGLLELVLLLLLSFLIVGIIWNAGSVARIWLLPFRTWDTIHAIFRIADQVSLALSTSSA